ncbi:MAG TPA: aminotransferase class I/II-fold pyridoxal phosphate-dependent enzyme [Clostridiales bacterium]|nr:aminotransferase class I/II-fold pyridoxal phosphate-dependent enzyme [Clostridiales bacterium]
MALIHGGDVESFIRYYGREPIDFSANSNPLGLPESAKRAVIESLETADRYPDPLSRRLREALSGHYNVPVEGIFCAAGAAEVIFRLAAATRPGKALLIAPGFAEYEIALNTVGCELLFYYLEPERDFILTESFLAEISEDLDVIFLCNPNNPTAKLIDPELLLRIADTCREKGVLLVLDECFNGFLSEPDKRSMRPYLREYPNLVILGAFTKIYGMAGLRLGYCFSFDFELIKSLEKVGQPWCVSSVASAAGIAALGDREYLKRSLELINEEREFLTQGLERCGVRVIGSSANFIFFLSHVPDLGSLCREKGFLIRDCSNYRGLTKGYYRIAVRGREENIKLLEAISHIIKAGS